MEARYALGSRLQAVGGSYFLLPTACSLLPKNENPP